MERRAAARQPDQKGTVLLLALIIMSSIVLSSLGIGSLIVSSLQQSRIIDSASVAYYAAESGAEEALYQNRRKDVLPAAVSVPNTLGNGATWKRTVSTVEDVLYVSALAKDTFTEIPLYDPVTSTSANIVRVAFTWTDKCAGCTRVTANLVGWKPGTVWDPLNTANNTFAYLTDPTVTTGGSASFSIPSPDRLYRLRIRAGFGDLDDLRVTGYDAAGNPVKLPGRVQVRSYGTYAGVQQMVIVSIPRRNPLSGAFDYVLFSECPLIKGGGAVACP